MLFIEGVGYVNDSITTANISNKAPVAQVNKNEFNKILEQETENLNNTEKTYNLEAIFKEASETYGISEDLLKAVAYNESRFQPDVTSSAGAMGIMQLMPGTASAMGVENAYDPYQNIMGGAKLLSRLSEMYDGNTSLMLAAYNAGTGTVAKYGGIPPIESVNNYIAKIYDTINSGVAQNVPDVTYSTTAAVSVTENANKNTQKNISDINKTAGNTSNPVAKNVNNPYNNALLSGGTPLAKTGETATTNIYDYRSSNGLNSLLSYSDYDLLVTFYDNMLEIISKLGDTGNDDNDNDLLISYLYNSGTYNKNKINLL